MKFVDNDDDEQLVVCEQILMLVSRAECNVLNVISFSRAEQAAFSGQERGKARPRDGRTPS